MCVLDKCFLQPFQTLWLDLVFISLLQVTCFFCVIPDPGFHPQFSVLLLFIFLYALLLTLKTRVFAFTPFSFLTCAPPSGHTLQLWTLWPTPQGCLCVPAAGSADTPMWCGPYIMMCSLTLRLCPFATFFSPQPAPRGRRGTRTNITSVTE